METQKYDDLVIGTGQGGKPLSQALGRNGRRVAIVERAEIGGSCVVSGCTPTKTWIASARVAHLVRHAERWGVSGPDSVAMDFERLRERKDELIHASQEAICDGFDEAGVDLLRGHARFVGPRQLEIERDGEIVHRVEAERVFLDTGSRPRVPDLDGLDQVPWIDHAGVFELESCPEHLLILGGGVIALEMAQMLRRFGARVTIVESSDRIVDQEDEDVSEALREILEQEGIEILTDAEASRVEGEAGEIRLVVEVDGESRTLEGSHFLVAVGRQPATSDLGLEEAGIETDDDGYVRVDEMLRTTAEKVWALGDVTGGPPFTHYSVDDYRILRGQVLGQETEKEHEAGDGEGNDEGDDRETSKSTRDRLVAYCMFTDPELGRVGLSESQAEEEGREVRVAKVPMERADRAREMGETRGFAKALVDPETDRIVGAAILGVHAGELMSIVQTAMIADLPYTAIAQIPYAHPTLAELLANLFGSLD